jgi:hypothetical protein
VRGRRLLLQTPVTGFPLTPVAVFHVSARVQAMSRMRAQACSAASARLPSPAAYTSQTRTCSAGGASLHTTRIPAVTLGIRILCMAAT